MQWHTGQRTVSDPASIGRAIKAAYEKAKVAAHTNKKTNVQEPEQDPARPRRVTIDDLGGRSDALGG